MKIAKKYKGVYNCYFMKLKYNAEAREVPFNLTLEDLGNLWEKQPICPYSKMSLTQKITKNDSCYTASLDRINPSKGYQKKNIQWVWKPLNKMKGTLTDLEFKKILKIIIENGNKKNN